MKETVTNKELETTLYVRDKFLISDQAFHELSMHGNSRTSGIIKSQETGCYVKY